MNERGNAYVRGARTEGRGGSQKTGARDRSERERRTEGEKE